MIGRFATGAVLCAALAGVGFASDGPENEVREFIARWNAAYTGMDAAALAGMETADFEMVDRFGHWIRSEGPQFNERLWAMTFRDIYRDKPGPARVVESVRFLSAGVAVVQARANHADGVTLDDGTRIPPFWEIDTYTLIRTDAGWRVALLNIHNQIEPGAERPGEHVPDAGGPPQSMTPARLSGPRPSRSQ